MKRCLALVAFLGTTTLSWGAGYLGVSAGYLTDGEEPIYFGRFGFEVFKTGTMAHFLEGELGYTTSSEMFDTTRAQSDFTFYMANYRLHTPIAPFVDLEAGGGIGIGNVDLRLTDTGFNFGDDDGALALQAFALLSFNVGPALDLTVGGRYISLGDATIFGIEAEIEDDLAVEVGMTFRF